MKYRYTVDTVALFAAFCLFLSTIEYMIPKPVPFFRLGLANLPIIISIAVFRPRDTLLLVFLKIAGQALVTGTLFSYIFIFSAAGTAASGIIMLFIVRLLKNRVSLTGASLAGALASNLIQVLFAAIFIFGESALYIAPPVLIMGFISAGFLGFMAEEFVEKSVWLRQKEEV